MNSVLKKLLALVVTLAEWNLSQSNADRERVEDLINDEQLQHYLRQARQQDALPVPRDPCVYDFLKIHPEDD